MISEQTTNATAVVSMLHEPATPSSATRHFRQAPVLAWTLERLSMARQLDSIVVLCWEDQLPDVEPIAEEHGSYVLAKGPRVEIGAIEAVSAARRWADGWRGGLLFTCDFDLGFYAPWVCEVVEKLSSDLAILVDPSAGLVDPKIIDDLIAHGQEHPTIEICFTPAAPGLGGALLRPALIERLSAARTHAGRLLHYLPDQPMRDPIGGDGCVAVPVSVARTSRNFRLDSDRQIERLTQASIDLNGQLVATDAEDLLRRLTWTAAIDPLPREIVLEINTKRATSPIFWPGKYHPIDRADMTPELAERIFRQIGGAGDIRLSVAGIGDPLLHPELFGILELARARGIAAIHVETDLLADGDAIDRLAESAVDVVSVHLPAMAQATYTTVMGVDALGQVIENIRRFVAHRAKIGRSTPLVVPTFVECKENLAEMEAWYDQWLRAVNAAVIRGASDFAGLIPGCEAADMSPPRRKACGRLWSRMTILCDGRTVSCEQDVTARQVMGDARSQSLQEIWQEGFGSLRKVHKSGCGDSDSLCGACREWHRP